MRHGDEAITLRAPSDGRHRIEHGARRRRLDSTLFAPLRGQASNPPANSHAIRQQNGRPSSRVGRYVHRGCGDAPEPHERDTVIGSVDLFFLLEPAFLGLSVEACCQIVCRS